MKKLLLSCMAILLACATFGCSSSTSSTATSSTATETSSEAVVESTTEETTEETTAWVYEGVGYDTLKATMGKADVDLSNADGVLASVLEKGVLVVATSPDYPPAEFIDEMTGEVKGSDMLLAEYIANSLGVELKIESMDFSAVLTSLDTGKSDLALSGFGYKADRAEIYELSNGYQAKSGASHHTILVRAEDIDKYNSLEDFNGVTICAQVNSLQEMYVNDQLPGATLEPVADLSQAILNLSSNKVDAVALDATTAKNHAENSNGMFVSVYVAKGIEFDLTMYKEVAGNVAACKKGETSLMAVVNAVIDDVMEKGLYADMYYAACDAAGVTPSEDD